jgi:UDP-N-acetylmuramate dehydrogenase
VSEPNVLPALAERTTLGVGGRPRAWAEAHDEPGLVDAVDGCARRGEPYVVLGGGSNVVAADEGFDGTVVAVATRGVRFARAAGGAVLVEAAAGEPWDALVARCVGEGLAGLECLAGIPGLVGATPIQNVGAYGQEVGDVIAAVRAYDPVSRRVETLGPHDCGFAYRDSAFKREGPGRRVVLAVTFALRPGPPAPVRYAELARALGGAGPPHLERVREAVLALRRSKSMVVDPDDPDSRSAGSFFTNPVLGPDAFAALRARLAASGALRPGEAVPSFEGGAGRFKVPAAWLIERAGIKKGERRGGAAVSRAHALAIVNREGATAADVVGLARDVRDRVVRSSGVPLTPEPVFVGFPPDPLGPPG